MRVSAIGVALLVVGACGGNRTAPSGVANRGVTGEPATCLPHGSDTYFTFGRDGEQLVICTEASPARCWNIDRASGTLSTRATNYIAGRATPLAPKASCYQGLCWPAYKPDDTSSYIADDAASIAFHADGKRAAVIVNDEVSIFDLASKKVTRSFRARTVVDQAGNKKAWLSVVGAMWFVGDTVFVLGAPGDTSGEYVDQPLFRYSATDGTSAPPLVVYGSGAGIAGNTLTIKSGSRVIGLTGLTVLDAVAATSKTTQRAVAQPCEPDLSSIGQSDFGGSCYVPYEGATFVPDGDGFVGLDIVDEGRRDLIQLDAKAVETSRTTLATCASGTP